MRREEYVCGQGYDTARVARACQRLVSFRALPNLCRASITGSCVLLLKTDEEREGECVMTHE